jgi:hypothetical protein
VKDCSYVGIICRASVHDNVVSAPYDGLIFGLVGGTGDRWGHGARQSTPASVTRTEKARGGRVLLAAAGELEAWVDADDPDDFLERHIRRDMLR